MNSTFRKYFADSVLMDFLPMQTNASSMSLPVNTSDICCHLKALPWPHTKSRLSKIGQYHEKSRTYNPSSALSISIVIYLQIFRNYSPAHVSYLQGYPLAFLR